MNQVRLLLVTLSGVLLSLLVLPATVAQAYPDPVCTITVSASELVGGEPLTVTVTSNIEADLTVSFLGDQRSAQDTTELVEVFQTPKVSAATDRTITASCDGVVRTATVTLLPAGGDGGDGPGGTGAGDRDGDSVAGILPGAGGPAFWLLLLGLVLVVAGSTVAVRRSRA